MEIAVVIATHQRSLLLECRSLKSVLLQSKEPNFLVVVDDSSDVDEKKENRRIVETASKKMSNTNVLFFSTEGDQGAACTWNLAVEQLLDLNVDPEELYIAFLDDDDAWDGDYLSRCSQSAEKNNYDLIASDFYRFEGTSRIHCASPKMLNSDDFLVGNPGIQGSNLFIRLRTFLEAGCFDEDLLSCTDRDLCIRLADMGNVRYHNLDLPLMSHFADIDRNRLSSPHSVAKNSGLNQFWLKYSKRMTYDQKDSFLCRAKTLFDWEPSRNICTDIPIVEENSFDVDAFPFWIGVICSDYTVIRPLLEQLAKLQNEYFVESLNLVILENQLSYEDELKISAFCRKESIDVLCITEEMQKQMFNRGFFSEFQRKKGMMATIAHARTMLQKYIGEVIPQDAVCWILDEDMQITSKTMKALKYLPKVKKSGVDILIGCFENSSPNPPINGIRVQLVDFLANLQWLCSCPGNEPLVDYSWENQLFRRMYPDYYYDLSRKHKGHLEHPYWITPETPTETVSSVLNKMLDKSVEIFFGNPLTRPLIAEEPIDFMSSLKDSVNRGGSTFIFNSKALSDSPNISFQISGIDVRRSDMMWSIINKYYRKMNVKAGNLSTWHAGKTVTTDVKMDVRKIRDEIIGSGFYAGLTEYLKDDPECSLDFSQEDSEKIAKNIVSHIKNRIKKLKMTFYRAKGISASLKRISLYTEDLRMRNFVNIVDDWFSDTSFSRIEKECFLIKLEDVELFLSELCTKADLFKETCIGG